jgi:propionate catabolism operon transcriptional regulator
MPDIRNKLNESMPTLESMLCSYSWPGNIRELENFIKIILATMNENEGAGALLSRVSAELQKRLLRANDTEYLRDIPRTPALDVQSSGEAPPNKKRGRVDEQAIKEALSICGVNYTKAAEYLGLSRITLWRKLKKKQALEGNELN